MAPQSLAIHLDLVGGIAGDMFVAAVLDALPHLHEPLFAELAKVQPRGRAAPALTATPQAGLRAARFGLKSLEHEDRMRRDITRPEGPDNVSVQARVLLARAT